MAQIPEVEKAIIWANPPKTSVFEKNFLQNAKRTQPERKQRHPRENGRELAGKKFSRAVPPCILASHIPSRGFPASPDQCSR